MDYKMIIEEANNLINAGCEYYTVKEIMQEYGYSLNEAKAIIKQMKLMIWFEEN